MNRKKTGREKTDWESKDGRRNNRVEIMGGEKMGREKTDEGRKDRHGRKDRWGKK